ncbi:hypothetical protein CR513_06376, partial [Mucuna pruriens]
VPWKILLQTSPCSSFTERFDEIRMNPHFADVGLCRVIFWPAGAIDVSIISCLDVQMYLAKLSMMLTKAKMCRGLKPINEICKGAFRESNSGPLAPKARIIPLDQMPTLKGRGLSKVYDCLLLKSFMHATLLSLLQCLQTFGEIWKSKQLLSVSWKAFVVLNCEG